MGLSILVTAYDERDTIARLLAAVAQALPGVEKELIVVDDCSRDSTREWLQSNFPAGARTATEIAVDPDGGLVFGETADATPVTIRPIYHERNMGKGGAVRTALAQSTGDVMVIQDADLEYDPHDWGDV